VRVAPPKLQLSNATTESKGRRRETAASLLVHACAVFRRSGGARPHAGLLKTLREDSFSWLSTKPRFMMRTVRDFDELSRSSLCNAGNNRSAATAFARERMRRMRIPPCVPRSRPRCSTIDPQLVQCARGLAPLIAETADRARAGCSRCGRRYRADFADPRHPRLRQLLDCYTRSRYALRKTPALIVTAATVCVANGRNSSLGL